MATTSRYGIPYPDENQDPWYNAFVSMMTQVDETLFAGFEADNIVVLGGGTVSWDGANLSWTSGIVVVCPSFGTLETLTTTPSPVAIADGNFMVLSLTRGATTAVSLDGAVSVVTQVPIDVNSYVFCYRSGTTLYFASGLALNSGDSIAGFSIRPPARLVVRETPTGLVNGSNAVFALANTPNTGSEQVFLNGLLQEPGAGNDYTIAAATITFLSAPLTGDRLRVTYTVPG